MTAAADPPADDPAAAKAAAKLAKQEAAVAEAVFFADAAAVRAWFTEHADTSDGIWHQFAKAKSGITSATRREVLDEALCHGWIDGQALSHTDERYSLQRYTPRRARSLWSQINRERVDELIADGRMTPRGQAEIDKALADGRMAAAYAPPSRAEPPAEFLAALEQNPAAKTAWEGLKGQARYSVIHNLVTAKRPETVTRRIDAFIAQLASGELK